MQESMHGYAESEEFTKAILYKRTMPGQGGSMSV